jgi:hypothetical protein
VGSRRTVSAYAKTDAVWSELLFFDLREPPLMTYNVAAADGTKASCSRRVFVGRFLNRPVNLRTPCADTQGVAANMRRR